MSPNRKHDIELAAATFGMSASEFIRFKVFDDIQTRYEERNRTGSGSQLSGSTFPETWDEFYKLTTARFLELLKRAIEEITFLRTEQAQILLEARDLSLQDAQDLILRFQIDMKTLESEILDRFIQISGTAHAHTSYLQEKAEAEK